LFTFFITGAQIVLPGPAAGQANPSQVAGQLPLPTSLAGFGVLVTQNTGQASVPLPIFSVEQVNHCSSVPAGSADCITTAITVEMPSNLTVPPGSGAFTQTTVAIIQNGVAGQAFNVRGLPMSPTS
jgi:hypothetical protein